MISFFCIFWLGVECRIGRRGIFFWSSGGLKYRNAVVFNFMIKFVKPDVLLDPSIQFEFRCGATLYSGWYRDGSSTVTALDCHLLIARAALDSLKILPRLLWIRLFNSKF